MAQFMLFMKGGYEAYTTMTPDEIQQNINKYSRWATSLGERDKLVSAEKLKDDGVRVATRKNGILTLDGPFAETKETIGGYFVVKAEDYDAALELAKDCPIFDNGGSVEIRQIDA